MAAKRITSHDVAQLAGVSRSTVSFVLNRSNSVIISKETRDRVFRAAADLGYKPNSAGRMLVSGVTETIGLVVSDPSLLLVDQFIPQLLFGIEKANREMGFHVLVEGLSEHGKTGAYDNLVVSRRIDGLIVLNPRASDEALISLIERDFPIVLVGSVDHPKEVSVTFGTNRAIPAAVDHVVHLGHRNIGVVTFAPRDPLSIDARLVALERSLKSHGLVLEKDAVEDGEFSAESGYRATLRLFNRRPDITAIFAGNDTIALGVITAAHEVGRSIPDDLSVVGFDDLHFASWIVPSLTTIRTEGVQQGEIAATMLFARLGHGQLASERVLLEPEFIVRNSTGPAP